MFRRLATAVLLLGLPSAALAQQKLAVVGVSTPPSMVGLGSQVSQNVLKTASALGLRATAPELIAAQLGDQQVQEAFNCGKDASCAVSKLQGVVADRAVLGSLTRDDQNYLVKLWLIDLVKGQVVTEVERSIPIASHRLVKDVTAALPGFLRGEQEVKGKVRVFANAKAVEISVDGERLGQTPILLSLKPGKHLVRAEKQAYMPMERYITVELNRTTDEQFRLVRMPGVKSPDDEPAEPEQVTKAGARKVGPSGSSIPPISWALGAGAVLVAGAGGAWLLTGEQVAKDQGPNYRQSTQAREDRQGANRLFVAAGAMAVTAVGKSVV